MVNNNKSYISWKKCKRLDQDKLLPWVTKSSLMDEKS